MQFRTLGRTGFEVSTIGFGAWGIGGSMWIGSTETTAMQTLHAAVEAEINFYDTALVYGDGQSEMLIGRAVREHRGRTPSGRPLFVATKVPPKNGEWPARDSAVWSEAYPPQHILESTEISLRNLNLPTIDLLQLHVWNDRWIADHAHWYPAIDALKQSGKIRAFGLSINSHQPNNAIAAVQSGLIDTVQVIYNIFEQSPEDKLFPACLEHRVGVIARVPLDEGGLTGAIHADTTFPEGDFRNRYFAGDRKMQVVARVDALQPVVQTAGTPDLATLALRFCASHPAVSTIIPGMRSPARVAANSAAADAGPLPPKILADLRAHRWER